MSKELAPISGYANVQDVTGAKTFTNEDSGKVFMLNAAAGAALTLPAVATARGVHYKFIIAQATATTDWVVTAATAVLQGALLEAGLVVLCANGTTINIELATDVLGDWVSVCSDGTNWYVDGVASGASFTVA